MQKIIFRPMILTILLLLGIALIMPTTAIAAGDETDLALPRSVVLGYLTALKTDYLDQATLTSFYLSDELTQHEIDQILPPPPLEGFEMLAESFFDDGDDRTYQAILRLTPSDQTIIIQAASRHNRWVITDLRQVESEPVMPSTNVAEAESPTSTGSDSTAQVVAYHLNVRSGPGIDYPILTVLDQGALVEIVATHTTADWLQVAQAGSVLGWISADPAYVAMGESIGETAASIITADQPPNSETDNGLLLLQPETGGTFYLVNPDGSELRAISSGIDPTFSPDGTQIAFTRWSSGGDGSVWIYDLASGTEWQLLGETRQAKSPTWSPDGTQLVVSFQQGGQPEIREVTKDPGTRPPADAYDISIGSESGRITYTLPADPHWQLRQIDLATGAYEDLPSATYSTAPTWDPANDWRVIFASSTGLQQLDLNRDLYFPFSTDLRDSGPVISPDGSQVAVTYRQHDHWEIYTINTGDGSRARLTESAPFTNPPANNAAPAWSPDGSQIVFITDRTGQWEYWIMDADGSNQRPLLPADTADQLNVQYHSVDERLIDWHG